MTALGGNTVKFIQVSPEISLYSWGIKIQDIPTDEDVNIIFQQMGIGQQKDLFRPQDIFIIKSLDNLKQMEQMIAHLYEKRVKEQRQFDERKITLNNEGLQQTAVVSEQAKQQTIAMEYQYKAELEKLIWEKEKDLLIIKMEYESQNNQVREAGRVQASSITADAKIQSSDIQSSNTLEKQHMANVGILEKQKIANEKPEKVKENKPYKRDFTYHYSVFYYLLSPQLPQHSQPCLCYKKSTTHDKNVLLARRRTVSTTRTKV
jgi:hypothetical protein